MPGTLTRPNANPILNMMRDGDTGDMWGLTMAWGFAVAEVLYDADPNLVPAELEYSPGMGGPEVPTGSAEPEPHRIPLSMLPYEHVEVWTYLHQTGAEYADDLPYWQDPTFDARIAELVTAGRCLARLADWLRADGRDY